MPMPARDARDGSVREMLLSAADIHLETELSVCVPPVLVKLMQIFKNLFGFYLLS
jgi:hypothetical protein